MDVPHVWGHNSETKAQIKNPKTCGPSKWPPLTKGMPYSWMWNVSIKKPSDNRKTGYRNIILEIYSTAFSKSHYLDTQYYLNSLYKIVFWKYTGTPQ